MPPAGEPQLVKYVFLDVVGFSRGRSVEAQVDIVAALNEVVSRAVGGMGLPLDDETQVILLPTGDGICVAIVKLWGAFDIHLALSIEILAHLKAYNDEIKDPARRFEVRIGLNQNVDNLVSDINGRPNVAGAGINTAQRVMNLADNGQILLGEAVHQTLCNREQYMKSFRRFSTYDKHNQELIVHQYIEPDVPGLNIEVPMSFRERAAPRPPLSLYQAYYLLEAMRRHEALIALPRTSGLRDAAGLLLHFLALDAEEERNTPPTREPHVRTSLKKFPERITYYCAQDLWVRDAALQHAGRCLEGTSDCFEEFAGEPPLFVTQFGRARLETEQPSVWQEYRARSGVPD